MCYIVSKEHRVNAFSKINLCFDMCFAMSLFRQTEVLSDTSKLLKYSDGTASLLLSGIDLLARHFPPITVLLCKSLALCHSWDSSV